MGAQFSSRVVKEYVKWLDRGRIPTMASLGRLTPSTADNVLLFLARAYVFGERIDDRVWMNDVMDAFTYVHIHDWRLELDDVILFTYKFSVSHYVCVRFWRTCSRTFSLTLSNCCLRMAFH